MARAPAEAGLAQAYPAAPDDGYASSLLDRLVEAIEGDGSAGALSRGVGQGYAAGAASRDHCRVDDAADLIAESRQAVLHGLELAATAEELTAPGNRSHAMQEAERKLRDALAGVRGVTGMILDLAKTAEDMAGVVDAVTSVARQANLLALHATIEAARAGEAGRGFEGVARDVKTLSEDTGHAARDMGDRIARLLDTAGASARAVERIMAAVQGAQPALAAAAAAVEDRDAALRQVARHATDLSIVVGGISERAAGMAATADACAAAGVASASPGEPACARHARFDTRRRS